MERSLCIRCAFILLCVSDPTHSGIRSVNAASSCVVDYDSPCPAGWNIAGDLECRAPLSYTGPCGVVAQMASADVDGKQQIERNCSVAWPCFDDCSQNFSASACPVGWIHLGNDLCEAPALYRGNCLTRVRMWDESFKLDFAARCDVHWPCVKDCVENFGNECPQDWRIINGICVAETGVYNGPCAPFADLLGMTQDEKYQWAAACAVDFPCSTTSNDSDCRDDESTHCPADWLLVGSERLYCYGYNYKGICRPLVSVENLQQIGRKTFTNRCAVAWPCTTVPATRHSKFKKLL